MTVSELKSDDAIQDLCRQNRFVIVCFSATWCGPCKASKPAFEDFSQEYNDVEFAVVYEHNLGDSIQGFNIRAFPTYVLFVESKENARVEGVNFEGVRQMIARAKKQIEGGHRLGGDVAGAEKAVKDVPLEPSNTDSGGESNSADNSRIANLNQEHLDALTGEMGFTLLRAQKGLLYGSGNVEGAVDWLMQHQDDPDIDEPIEELREPLKAESYKCNDCGKILSSVANLELHANKTGHTDFEESTQVAKSLTPEEKAKKLIEVKELLKAKRSEREEREKADDVEREKQRRFMGKEMAKTREQLEVEQRRREALKRRKEKEEFKRERERLRAELAKDKAERQANKGKLTSKLGVGGYKPDSIQYENQSTENSRTESKATPPPPSSGAKIESYIEKISSYRAGGDGGKCLKILLAYVGNLADNPGEEKFKTVNMENKAYRTKVKPFLGAKQLLLAVGFKPSEDGNYLCMKEEPDENLLKQTKSKLEAALRNY